MLQVEATRIEEEEEKKRKRNTNQNTWNIMQSIANLYVNCTLSIMKRFNVNITIGKYCVLNSLIFIT